MWMNYLTSISLNSLNFKMGVLIPISKKCVEDYWLKKSKVLDRKTEIWKGLNKCCMLSQILFTFSSLVTLHSMVQVPWSHKCTLLICMILNRELVTAHGRCLIRNCWVNNEYTPSLIYTELCCRDCVKFLLGWKFFEDCGFLFLSIFCPSLCKVGLNRYLVDM